LGLNDKISNLEPADILLGHWLTYIFDYGMPAEKVVWKKAFPIMVFIAHRFRRGTTWKIIIKEHIKSVVLVIKIKKIMSLKLKDLKTLFHLSIDLEDIIN
jgi:hypothetical protein